MPINAKLYRVLIASPGDVAQERGVVREEISRWNSMNSMAAGIILLPIGWETDSVPDLKEPGQAVINRQLVDDCDLLIGVFWTRIGTPTPEAESGTVEEIERSAAEGKRCIVYFSDQPAKPSEIDRIQYDRLQTYKEELNKRGLTSTYKELSEFREKVFRHISTAIQKIQKEDKERRAAEQEAKIAEQAMGLENQGFRKHSDLIFESRTLTDAEQNVKYLIDSRFGIQDLEDIKEKEIANIKNALESHDLSSFFKGRPTVEDISAISQIIETASISSIFTIFSVGKYADENLVDWSEITGDWIERLSTRKSESGYEWVSYIKTYPGLLTFYSLGISALRSGKTGFLREVTERNVYYQGYNEERA